MSFADIANERGLPAAAALLDELTWECEAHAYHRNLRHLSPTVPLDPLLALAARLRLAPQISNTLLDVFPDRPMEHALIAYDIASDSLLGTNDDALRQRIIKELAPLRALGPLAPVAIPRDRVTALLDAVRPAADAAAIHGDFETLPSLAALAQFTHVSTTLDDYPQIVDATLAHVKVLAKAHLPSLAIAFVQLLWHCFAVQRALDLMVELALDHDMLYALPEVPVQGDEALRLHAYMFVRAALAQFNTRPARDFLAEADQHPAIRDATDPRLLVARAELALLDEQPVPEDLAKVVEEVGMPAGGWRYACRVRDEMTIRRFPSISPSIVDGYICYFGNDPYLWASARDDDAMRAELLPLVSREARFASYDPHVWRAVSLFVANGEPINNELDRRMQAQLESLFAGP